MSPQRKAGTILLRDGFLFPQDNWTSFQEDSRIFLVFSKGQWTRFFGLWTLDGLTQEYGLVFRTLDLLWFFGFLDRFFFRTLDFKRFFYWTLDHLNSFDYVKI